MIVEEPSMSVVGHPEGEQPEKPSYLLLALINVPAVLLLAWLALDCCTRTAVSWWAIAGQLLRLAGVVAALGCNWLLCRRAGRAASGLRESLQRRSDEGERLRAVLETAADAILTADETGRIASCN